MEIELFQSMGFAGTKYTLLIDKESHELGDSQHGVDESKARDEAKKILAEKQISIDIDTIPFRWRGTL